MVYVWMVVVVEYDECMNLDQVNYLKENYNLLVFILDKIVDDIVMVLDEGSFNVNKLFLDKFQIMKMNYIQIIFKKIKKCVLSVFFIFW